VNRKDTNDAIRLSLLMGETRAERHGVYARRKVAPTPVVPLRPLGWMEDPTGFAPGCFVDSVPPEAA
jgi:hypothetical protein